LPLRQKSAECCVFDRLDFFAQSGQRSAAQRAQHVGFTPFSLGAIGLEFTSYKASGGLECHEHSRRPFDSDSETLSDSLGHKWGVSTREATHDFVERMGHWLGERCRQTKWQGATERVAIPTGIFCGDETLVTGKLACNCPTI